MARLIGENLVLREFTKEDLPHIREWVNDHEVTRYLSDVFLYPHSLKDSEKFLDFVLANNSETTHEFVIAKKDSLDYIGQIGLIHIDLKNRSAEMGITIGKKDCQGKGIGTEAIDLLQYFAFYRLNLNRVQLHVHAFNHRAIGCYKKCGFIEEGRIRQRFYLDGQYTDSLLMSILKDEYASRESRIRSIIKQSL